MKARLEILTDAWRACIWLVKGDTRIYVRDFFPGMDTQDYRAAAEAWATEFTALVDLDPYVVDPA